jgi:hypothetical protein
MHAVRRACAVVVFALCAIGCGDGGNAAPIGTFSAIYPMLFPADTNAKCNSCHSMPASDVSNGRLHMGTDKATAYASLVGQASTGSKCKGQTLVVPNQPDMSLLLQKVMDTPPCGERMPLGGPPLSDAQRDMVRSWIADGAKDD